MAQVRVTAIPAAEQAAHLESSDPQLAANKKIAYDFWRMVLVARDMDAALIYMDENYIQHNPTIPTGRETFMNFFGRMPSNEPLEHIEGLVEIVAEGDLVVMSFLRENENPNEPGETYTTTWFDMFRVINGKIGEHWDYGLLQAR